MKITTFCFNIYGYENLMHEIFSAEIERRSGTVTNVYMALE